MDYRQGDITLHKIEEKPKNLSKRKDNTLAYGEITGHRHWLNSKQQCVLEDSNGQKYIELEHETELVHSGPELQPIYDTYIAKKQDKHLTIKLEPGLYVLHQEREYDYLTKKIEQVLD